MAIRDNMDYKLLQITNTNIGARAVNSFLPFGSVTGRINCPYRLDGAISVTTSTSDTIVIGKAGHYLLTYNASVVAGAAGIVEIALIINGTEVYKASASAASGATVVIPLTYKFKVKDIPTNVQVKLLTTAITDGQSNTIVERL